MEALEFELKLKITASEVHIIGAGGTGFKFTRTRLPLEIYNITQAVIQEHRNLLTSMEKSIKVEGSQQHGPI